MKKVNHVLLLCLLNGCFCLFFFCSKKRKKNLNFCCEITPYFTDKKYQGCVFFQKESLNSIWELPNQNSEENAIMSPFECLTKCSDYQFYGLQNIQNVVGTILTYCYCTDINPMLNQMNNPDSSSNSTFDSELGCMFACAGNVNAKCGFKESDSIAVYEITQTQRRRMMQENMEQTSYEYFQKIQKSQNTAEQLQTIPLSEMESKIGYFFHFLLFVFLLFLVVLW